MRISLISWQWSLLVVFYSANNNSKTFCNTDICVCFVCLYTATTLWSIWIFNNVGMIVNWILRAECGYLFSNPEYIISWYTLILCSSHFVLNSFGEKVFHIGRFTNIWSLSCCMGNMNMYEYLFSKSLISNRYTYIESDKHFKYSQLHYTNREGGQKHTNQSKVIFNFYFRNRPH